MDKVSLSKAFSNHYMEFLDEVVKYILKALKYEHLERLHLK